MERISYVYMYRRLDGTPCYVGKGKGDRWKFHKYFQYNPNFRRLFDAAARLGEELPVEFLCTDLTDEEACEIEVATIAFIGRKKYGGPLVNLTDGGEGLAGLEHSQETKAKLSAWRTGRTFGPRPQAVRDKIRDAQKGVPRGPMSAEHKAAISRGGTGLKRSQETKDRISAALRGKSKSAEHREAISRAAALRRRINTEI